MAHYQTAHFKKEETMNELTTLTESIINIVKRTDLTMGALNEESISLLSSRMPEIERATKAFGKQNSQVTGKLMTLTMLSPGSPYHTLRQILAQIEKKRGAVRETYYKFKKEKVELAIMQREKAMKDGTLESDLIGIEIEEKQANAAGSMLYVEGALKEIGAYQTAYGEICEAHNIPAEWDELEVENAEVAHHIKSAFRNGVRDVMAHGRLGMGTLEYLEQFGINPATAHSLIGGYLEKCSKTKEPSYADLMRFLDACADKFKDSYLAVMDRLGLKTLIDEQWLYKTGE